MARKRCSEGRATSGGEADLSGRWTGIYSYSSRFPPNTFEATIRDAGGSISGVIVQPREFFEAGDGMQHAVIDGSKDGTTIRFVKIYDDLDRPTPHYEGTIQPGGDEVEGRWTIPGDWSGSFMMIRAAGAEERAVRKEAEKV
ncbi:MAG: hypothetical protein AB7O91_08990 [Sphingomonas sp.]